jgi:hypothetical protein
MLQLKLLRNKLALDVHSRVIAAMQVSCVATVGACAELGTHLPAEPCSVHSAKDRIEQVSMT